MAASSSITWASEVPGTRREVRGTITFDSSYPTGGEAVTLAQLGLTRLDWLSVETIDGYVPAWDGSTSAPKVKLFWVDGPYGTRLEEVTATQNVATTSVRFHAIGA